MLMNMRSDYIRSGTTWMRTTKNGKWQIKWNKKNIQPRKRQNVRKYDNNKRKTKIRNIEFRATSIGPKPFLFCWCYFHVETKKGSFPLQNGISVHFWMSSFFLPSLSHFPFLVPLSLSLSHSWHFFVLFLPCFYLFMSLFCCFWFLFCFFVFVSCKEEHQDNTS